jgi:autotransporter strand-loop-strand O-heptosyltransferase
MKTCLIYFDDKSVGLGDIIATIPYIEKFRVSQNLEVYVKIKRYELSNLFELTYPNIKFIKDGDNIICDKKIVLQQNVWSLPIQQIFASQLGFINAEYIKPIVDDVLYKRTIKNKYVVISTQSTSQLKYWNHVNGKKEQFLSTNWNDLCRMLRKSGYTPICVDNYENFGIPPLRNFVPKQSVNKIGLPLKDVMGLIKHCEFFIGLSSGLTWLAHAMDKPVCMISNFTEDWHEFDLNIPNYKRITNKSVCHGCWNLVNKEFSFDYEDWYWCPKHKDTERQFECHTSITPQMVFEEIKNWIV